MLFYSKMHSYFYCLVILEPGSVNKIKYHSVFWPIMENEIFEIIILAFFMALLDRLAEE